jgi:hypothetical protein
MSTHFTEFLKGKPMQSDISFEVADITTITIQLNELRSKFDQGMREGQEPSDLRDTYLQMKELECYLKALQWEPEGHNNSVLHPWG